MPSIGIDIATAAKAALEDGRLAETLGGPTGFSSVDAAERLAPAAASRAASTRAGLPASRRAMASRSLRDRVVTEITCHGKGAAFLFGGGGTWSTGGQ